MKKVLMVLALATSVNASAAEKIEGDFGLKLGAKFDPSKAIGTAKSPEGRTMYEFKPTEPYNAFNHYYVLIDSSTKVIWSIRAEGTFGSTAVADQELIILRAKLRKKYYDPQSKFAHLKFTGFIGDQNRGLKTYTSGSKGRTVELIYLDRVLRDQSMW